MKLRFEAPPHCLRFIAEKGSIGIDGVSLTVNQVDRVGFEVVLVPYSQGLTVLTHLAPGAEVNVETDILARYIARYIETRDLTESPATQDATWLQRLKDGGYM